MMSFFKPFVFLMFVLSLVSLSAHPKFMSNNSAIPCENTTARADSAHGFDVIKYDINLSINDQTHYINGSVLANVTAQQNLTGIDYNLIGLTVTEVKVNDVIATYTHQNGILHINLTANLGETFTTKVTYSGNPQLSPTPYNIGIIFSSNTVFTLSDPDAGRYWWPCYDHPWDKAIVDLHITMRSDWLVACNGLRSSITDNGNGTKTHNWLGSNPMATYLVCFTAGPYQEINQTAGTIPIQNFVTAGQYNNAVTDFSTLPTILQFFETQFGPYPFEKYGNAVVSMTTYGAMEHQTMTTLGQQYITGNHSGELTIAHELAHQWYGDCLTPLTFKDVWLSEGFATYSELLWTHKKSGWQAACDYANSAFHQYYLSWESSAGPQTIYNPAFNNYFNPQSYEKAASVLHMLRLRIGNDHFFQLLQTWFSTYHNSNVITSEFQAMAEQISGQDLDYFFSQWIYGSGIPTVECTFLFNPDTWEARINGKTISNTQTPFYMDIPLVATNFAAGDSIVFQATPGSGASNMFSITDNTNPYNVIGIDPNHWTLNRGITIKDVVLTQCLASNQSVLLNWNDFSSMIHFAGYHVYRRINGQTDYIRLTDNPLTTTSYVDNTAQNGVTYYYKIKAIDAWNFQTLGSNEMSATPLEFPFDWGILVVDETKDGNGTSISPTDAMVDTFYAGALSPINYSNWDYNSLGAPSLNTLAHYPIILWHADDFGQNLINTNLDNLGSYILGGGKLIISGWKTPGSFTPAFNELFMPGVTLNYFNASVLVSAQSAVYPVLTPDPNRLTAAWNGIMPMVYTFQNATNVLYTASMVPNTSGHGEPLAARFEHNGTLIVLGFPLYCMQDAGARAFLQQLIHELDPTQAIDDNAVLPVKLNLSCYPNPFSDKLYISFNQKINPAGSIKLYNIKGQYINSIDLKANKTGNNSLQWTPADAKGQHLPAGIYLLRYNDVKSDITQKIMLLN